MRTRIITSKPHPEQGYRSCLGIMSLGKMYGHERLEAASRRALACNAASYIGASSPSCPWGSTGSPWSSPRRRSGYLDTITIRGAAYYAQKGAGQ